MLNEIAPRTRPNRDDAGHVPGGRDIQAPFADEVLRLRRTPVTVLVTQSAHKSMSAARQGSYLHVVGESALPAYQMLPEPAPAGTNRDDLTADPTKLLIGTRRAPSARTPPASHAAAPPARRQR